MDTTRFTSRPWMSLVAIAATLLVASHGASAAEPAATQVDVVAQMPLQEACPSGETDLAESLAGAWDDAVKPSTVGVTFELHRHSVYGVVPRTDSARAFHEIRRAVHALRCDGGDDAVHTVRFDVRFVDRTPDARVALATAAPRP